MSQSKRWPIDGLVIRPRNKTGIHRIRKTLRLDFPATDVDYCRSKVESAHLCDLDLSRLGITPLLLGRSWLLHVLSI